MKLDHLWTRELVLLLPAELFTRDDLVPGDLREMQFNETPSLSEERDEDGDFIHLQAKEFISGETIFEEQSTETSEVVAK